MCQTDVNEIKNLSGSTQSQKITISSDLVTSIREKDKWQPEIQMAITHSDALFRVGFGGTPYSISSEHCGMSCLDCEDHQ